MTKGPTKEVEKKVEKDSGKEKKKSPVKRTTKKTQQQKPISTKELPKSMFNELKMFIELGDFDRVQDTLNTDQIVYKEWSTYKKIKHHRNQNNNGADVDNVDDEDVYCSTLNFHKEECWECRMVRYRGLTTAPFTEDEMKQAEQLASAQSEGIVVPEIIPATLQKAPFIRLANARDLQERASLLKQDPWYFPRSRLNITEAIKKYTVVVSARKVIKVTSVPDFLPTCETCV